MRDKGDVADVHFAVSFEVTFEACDGDVIGPGERVRAVRGADREVHGVGARCSVGMDRVLLRRGVAVAEVPEPGGRVAGGEVSELNREWYRAGGDVRGEVRRRYRYRDSPLTEAGDDVVVLGA
ncbi:hypothetical protein DSECCO2_464240 [anaerobic digester metagenome]